MELLNVLAIHLHRLNQEEKRPVLFKSRDSEDQVMAQSRWRTGKNFYTWKSLLMVDRAASLPLKRNKKKE